MVIIALIQQIISVKRQTNAASCKAKTVACRQIQRPIAVGWLLGWHYIILFSNYMHIQPDRALAVPFVAVLEPRIGRPRCRERQSVALFLTRQLLGIQILAVQFGIKVPRDFASGLTLNTIAQNFGLSVMVQLQPFLV